MTYTALSQVGSAVGIETIHNLERLREHLQNQQEESALLGDAWREHGLIFASEVGTPITPRNLSRHFYTVLTAAELGDVRFHDLRHSCATWMGELGVAEAVIGAILGHSASNVTRKYVHATKAAMREAVELIERLLCDRESQEEARER